MESSLPDIAKLAIPFYVLFIFFEIFLIRKLHFKGKYEIRDATTSISMGLGSVLIGAIYASLLATLFLWVYTNRLFTVETSILSIAFCFILDDFRYYWSHRLRHTIRWSWASHVIHHSSQHYNLSTALRQSWTGPLSGMFILTLPLLWLGFHPGVVLFVSSINLVYQFFIHTETIRKCPLWIEAIFNTPSHHRVHHSRELRYLDANYGGVFIVWDKVFGSFVPEQDTSSMRYGLIHNITTFNPLRVATHEYIAIAKDLYQSELSVKQRLGYLFAPPGWSHDGTRMHTKQRKRKYIKEHPDVLGEPGFEKKYLE